MDNKRRPPSKARSRKTELTLPRRKREYETFRSYAVKTIIEEVLVNVEDFKSTGSCEIFSNEIVTNFSSASTTMNSKKLIESDDVEMRESRNVQYQEQTNQHGLKTTIQRKFNALIQSKLGCSLMDAISACKTELDIIDIKEEVIESVEEIKDNDLKKEPSENVEELNSSTIKEEFKCDICNFHCLTAAELSKHEESCNVVHKCPLCSGEIGLRSEFSKQHQKVNNGKNFKCGQCGSYYVHKCTLFKHMNRDHGCCLYKCTMCNYQSVVINEVQVHEQSHTNDSENALATQDLCNFLSTSTTMNSKMLIESENVETNQHGLKPAIQSEFTPLTQLELGRLLLDATSVYETELDIDINEAVIDPFEDIKDNNLNLKEGPSDEHVEDFKYTHLTDLSVGKKEYKCDICNYKCYYVHEPLSWIIKRHQNASSHCNKCNFHCLAVAELSKHEKSCEVEFKCTFCYQEFDFKWEFSEHIKEHNDEKRYKCGKCSDFYLNKSALKEHMVRDHQGLFKCTICKYQSVFEKQVKVHMQSHTKNMQQPLGGELKNSALSNKEVSANSKNYICENCGKRFKCAYYLKRHFATHTGEKPYKCHLCPKEFVFSSSIRKHLLTHKGSKPFCCHICDYKCTSRDRLRCHMRIHTGEKPFKCIICDYQCSYKVSLQNHMQVHTGKQFCCELCDYECSDKVSLKKHVKSHNKK